jgi:hypothetical protein
MLVGAKSAVPFFEGVHFYYGCAFILAVVGLWVKPVGPWVRPRFNRWRDRRLLMNGRPAVQGVADEVLPLGRRLKRTEQRLGEVISVTTRLDNGQKAIVERMDLHDVKVTGIDEKLDNALEMLTHLFENGKNSNNPGDLNARMAEAQGVYLVNPEVKTYDPHKDEQAPQP